MLTTNNGNSRIGSYNGHNINMSATHLYFILMFIKCLYLFHTHCVQIQWWPMKNIQLGKRFKSLQKASLYIVAFFNC